MDQINANFGALRVSGVPEFVPAALRQQQAAGNAKSASAPVKEFVPGKGLVDNASSTSKAKEFVPGRGLVDSAAHGQQNQQKYSSQSTSTHFQHGVGSEQQQQTSVNTRMAYDRRTYGSQQQQQSQQHIHQSTPSVHDEVGQAHGLTLGRPTLTNVPRRRTLRSFYLPDDLRSYFAGQARATVTSVEPDDPVIKELPRKFHSIYPLDEDPTMRNVAGSTGYPSAVFKAINSKDGFAYAVRRVDNVRIHANIHQVQATWARVVSPNVVSLREVFTQSRALYLVHDYLPGAQSLREFIHSRSGPNAFLPEGIVWSFLVQILNGVRAVHDAGLACRDLNPSRVLITGRFRVRIASAGLIHALEPNSSVQSLQDQQFEDLMWVSRLALCLGCMSLQGLTDFQSSLQFIQGRYSPDLLGFALLPIKAQMNKQRCTTTDLMALANAAMLAETDALYAHSDALEENLARMHDCDRMFRLMSKLSLICERPPPPGIKPADSWSETDDRYVIKLFRNYVFHQVDDMGKPVVDFGHIIDCLNKLDAGAHERLLLASRDGRSFLVVTYEDVRLCIDKAFNELFQGSSFHQE